MSADPPTRRNRKPGKRALAAERRWCEPAILDALEREPLAAFRRALEVLGEVPGLVGDEGDVRRVAGLLPSLELPPTVADAVRAVGGAVAAWRRRHALPRTAEAHAWQHLEQAALVGPGVIGRDVHLDVLPPRRGGDWPKARTPERALQLAVAKTAAALVRLHADEQAQAVEAEMQSEARAVAGAIGGRKRRIPEATVEDWRARAAALWASDPAPTATAIATVIDPAHVRAIRRAIADLRPSKLA